MAILGQNGKVTLADHAKAMDPEGNIADVVELLSQTNELLPDMVWLEGNLPTGHQTTVRTGLPTAIWRKLYQGVPASKSTRARVTDTCGMLETRAEIDKDVVELNGNSAQFRMSEGYAFLEAMNQEMATAMFYGDADLDPEKITGLSPRYNDLTAENGQNILDAGGAGADNASVWLVVWGNNTIHGIYPKGSTAGLKHEDLGIGDAFDGDNNRYRAYMDHWQWKCGLTVRDWRYAVRIANIDVSDLQGQSGTQAASASTALIKLLVKARHLIPSEGMGKAVIYCNRTVRQMLDIAALEKSSSVLKISEAAGQFKTDFMGIPIRTVDALLNTEARVV